MTTQTKRNPTETVRALRAAHLHDASREALLAMACARMNVTLVHARPYDAPARGKMERFGSSWGGPPSSGNHAFDEYRTETLRRLEEEQREFREFLERLRFARDKTEFDQFMAERRARSASPPPPPPQS